MNVASLMLRVLIRAYQVLLAPLALGSCRYDPTCSQYAIDAITNHGALSGVRLAARRVLRCHPWGGCGYDPAPPACNAGAHGEHGTTVR